MSTKTFAAGMILVGALLAAAIFTASTLITILGCIAGVGFAVAVGATVFAVPRVPPAAPIAPETPVRPAGGSMHDLLEQLYPDSETGTIVPVLPTETGTIVPVSSTAVPAPLRLVDADTGELVGDRVLRLEERCDSFDRRLVDLGDVVAEQNQLITRALATLRREVERITHVFVEDTANAN